MSRPSIAATPATALLFLAAALMSARPAQAQPDREGQAPAPVTSPGRTAPANPLPMDLAAWKEHLANMTDGAWITSNAEYRDEDGALDAFGMDYTAHPGGLSATGCLWSEQEGQVVNVAWTFFMGWDPVEKAGLIYQSSGAGMVAIGYLGDPSADAPSLVQELFLPDGSSSRVGHFEEMDGPDRRITRSVSWNGGEWAPRRSYTWIRDRERVSPCPG